MSDDNVRNQILSLLKKHAESLPVDARFEPDVGPEHLTFVADILHNESERLQKTMNTLYEWTSDTHEALYNDKLKSSLHDASGAIKNMEKYALSLLFVSARLRVLMEHHPDYM